MHLRQATGYFQAIKGPVSGNNSDKNAIDEALFRHHIGIVLVVYEETWS
jgi:hypothetical protein